MQPDLIIGTDLDALLAPLDDAGRVATLGEPTRADYNRAYALGMLGADMTEHLPSPALLEICREYGVSELDAITIGRAFSGALLRVAQTVGTIQAE